MKISLSAFLTRDTGTLRPDGVHVGCKTSTKARFLQVRRRNTGRRPGQTVMKTPTGGTLRSWTLPLGIWIRISNDKRVSHLVGFPPDSDLDDIIAGLDENYDELALAALRYQRHYSWTDESDRREEYDSIIAALSGKHRETFEMSEEEQMHLRQIYAKRANSWSGFPSSCGCQLCQDMTSRVEAIRERNARDQTEARQRFHDILPQLWD